VYVKINICSKVKHHVASNENSIHSSEMITPKTLKIKRHGLHPKWHSLWALVKSSALYREYGAIWDTAMKSNYEPAMPI
jgi:hypothetical protein